MIILLIIAIAALALFYSILQFDIPGTWKFALVVVEMVIVTKVLTKKYNLKTEMGLILLRSKRGIGVIDRIAKHERMFKFIADVGSTIAYGLLSFVLMRKNVNWKSTVVGFAMLAALFLVVAPYAFAILLTTINMGGAEQTISSTTSNSTGTALGLPLVAGLLIFGGMFLIMLAGIVFYGTTVLIAIVKTVFFGTDTLAKTAPGGTMLLPGINLPFFEGIAALAIVMVVHEVSHAVLARIGRVPIESSGLVLFGVIPVGAFVEPDEKRLARLDADKQTRVLVAGPTANWVSAVLLFVLFIAFTYSTAGLREQGMLVLSGMAPGTVIYAINGQQLDTTNFTLPNITKSSKVTLLTNNGEIEKQTNDQGKMGITYSLIDQGSIRAKYKIPGLEFIYLTLGLSLALNFVVGTVNILPVPLFDGYRIIEVNVKNKRVVQAISYTALLFFALNFLPLLLH